MKSKPGNCASRGVRRMLYESKLDRLLLFVITGDTQDRWQLPAGLQRALVQQYTVCYVIKLQTKDIKSLKKLPNTFGAHCTDAWYILDLVYKYILVTIRRFCQCSMYHIQQLFIICFITLHHIPYFCLSCLTCKKLQMNYG